MVDDDDWYIEYVQANGPWEEAVITADTYRDDLSQTNDESNLRPLIELFRSDFALPPASRLLIADLLERHRLQRKDGRPRTPKYRLSKREAELLAAAREVLSAVETGSDRDDSIDRIAADWEMESQTLRNFLDNRRASSRRMRTPRPKPW